MAAVGSESTILVVLRGNSGSGKTATAREVRLRCGRGIAIVSQDVIRRDLLREKDVPGGVNVGLIDTIARHALDEGYHVILEGILHSAHYGAMLHGLCRAHRGRTVCFYFDVPFEETLRRHATKPQAAEYGAPEMRSWYRPLDLVPELEEHRIDPSYSLDEAVDLVIAGSGLPGNRIRSTFGPPTMPGPAREPAHGRKETPSMSVRFAERMSRLGTETAFEVLVRARALEAQGKDVVHLEVGEPDFDTPENVIEAGVEALQSGWTHYGPANGDAQLRDAIVHYINGARGLDYTADQVVVTPGGKPVMFFLILALLQAGDEAIYPDPGFPIYGSMINFSGATPVPIPLREENDFGLDVDELEGLITERTRLLIINSPANPTGGVLDRGELERIAQLAVEHDLIVMADEIYAELIYDGEHISIATFPGMAERTVILDGFSKTYAMTGWRLGYGIFPKDLAPAITKLAVNSVSCTSVAVQRAGIAALTGPQDRVGEFREAFRSRRGLIVDGLNAIDGISCVMPRGAFYAFPNITRTGLTSKEFADRLLDEYGVAGIAGTSFGAAGEGYLRLSYANSEANLEKALERVATMTKDVLS